MSYLGFKHSEETKCKIGNARRGQKHTEEAKRKVGEASKGRIVSQETKNKISNAMKNNKNGIRNKSRKGKTFTIKTLKKKNPKKKNPWNKGLTKETSEIVAQSSYKRKGIIPSQKTREKISIALKGKRKPPFSNETKKRMSETRCMKISSGEIKLPHKYFDTSIEIAIEKQLKHNNYKYEKQKYIKNVGIVDFFLTDHNIIIECDGDFWHSSESMKYTGMNMPQKDADRDLRALFNGYETIRLWEKDIKEDSNNCLRRITTTIKKQEIGNVF